MTDDQLSAFYIQLKDLARLAHHVYSTRSRVIVPGDDTIAGHERRKR